MALSDCGMADLKWSGISWAAKHGKGERLFYRPKRGGEKRGSGGEGDYYFGELFD